MANYHSVSGLCWLQHGTNSLYQQVPLQNVRVDATLYDLCAEVTVQQTYVNNPHSEHGFSHVLAPPECVYIFPLDEESAVFSFAAELDGVVVEGRIREKMDARAEYKSAIALQRSAMLLEQSSDNIFQCKIGNLNYGSVCTVTLTYLTLLEQEGRHNRFILPMIIAPKYTPAASPPGLTPPFPPLEPAPHNTIHKGYYCHYCLCSPVMGTRHRCDTCASDLCNGCYMHHDMSHHIVSIKGQIRASSPPPTLPTPSSQTTTIQSTLRDLTIKLTITMPSPIVSIQCPSHSSETKIVQNKEPSNQATALYHSFSTCSLAKDFVLLVEQQRCFEPRVLCELDVANHTAAVSLAFLPPPVDMLSASQIHCELVFLIDCSGSMHGSSIACVRECMQLLLRSLPIHSRFNIVVFGSRWSSLFPSSRAYDDSSLSAASQYISQLQANLGGTEIYPPLLHVLTSDILPTHPRQVFLLTDGQVSNVKQLAQLTLQHAVSTRLFTFGIGDSVDRLLCKKLAQVGRGKCEFVAAEDGGGSTMREKVVRQVARAMQPVLTDVKVNWRQLQGPISERSTATKEGDGMSTGTRTLPSTILSTSFLQCPSVAPAIFMSSRYMLHALNVTLPDIVWQQAKAGHNVDFESEITIIARSNHPHETEEHMQLSVVLTGEQITQARVIHTLAAKERIRELEDKLPSFSEDEKKKLEDEILNLAMKHTLSSSRTSFVVVYNPGTLKERVEEMAPLCKAEEGYDCFASPMLSLTSFASTPTRLFGCKQKIANPKAYTGATFGSAHLQCSLPASAQRLCASRAMVQPHDIPRASVPLPLPLPLPSRNVHQECAVFENAQTGDLLCSTQTGQNTNAFFGSAPSGDLFGSVQQEDGEGGMLGCKPGWTNLSINRSAQPGADSSAAFASVELLSKVSQTTWEDAKSTAFEVLVQLQSAKGMWHITPSLIDIAHTLAPLSSTTVTMQSLQAISKEHGVDEAVVGVILALQLLETHYKPRHAEWEMLATKALFFLNKNDKVSTDIKDSIAKLLFI